MKIFDKRPLSLILCIMLSIFVLGSISKIYVPVIILIATLTAFAISFVKISEVGKFRKIIRIISIGALVSLTFSYTYFNLYMKAYDRFDSESVSIKGVVEDIDYEKEYSNAVTIKAYNVNEKPFSAYRFIAYLDEEDTGELEKGDVVELSATISEFYSGASYYFAKGYNGVLTEPENICITDRNKIPIKTMITEYRIKITEYIVDKANNKDAGGLFAALITGERDFLSDELYLDFKLMGITHILALSGMHLAILAMLLEKILSFLGISKKPRITITSLFIVIYTILTGLPSAVTRAAIMFLLTTFLYLFSRSHDSITSLFIAITLICAFKPYAIYDLSLWLSAFATLGVLIAYELAPKIHGHKLISTIGNYILASLFASLFAISSTLLITNIFFGGISIISPITTLIFSALSEVYIYFGFIMLLITPIFQNVEVLTPIYTIIDWLSENITKIDGIYVSVDFLLSKIITAVLTIVLIVFLVMPIKHKWRATLTISVSLLSLFICSYFCTVREGFSDSITYLSDNGHDAFLIANRGVVSLVDFQNYKENGAYDAAEYVGECKLAELDNYIMTEYNGNMTDMLSTLLSQIKIDAVYLPKPLNDKENSTYKRLLHIAENYGIPLFVFDDEGLKLGEITLYPLHRNPEDPGTCIYTVLFKNNFYTYFSSGTFTGKTKVIAEKYLSGSHTIILGKYGKNYDKLMSFEYKIEDINTFIINSDNVFFSSDYNLYYLNSGTEIYIDKEILNITD